MLATLDNLNHNALEAELGDIRESFSDEQMAFLLRLRTTSGNTIRPDFTSRRWPAGDGEVPESAEEKKKPKKAMATKAVPVKAVTPPPKNP